MANNFSSVLPVIIGLALKTLREQALITRFINRDFENVPAAQGDTVNVTVASAKTVNDVAPSAAPFQGQSSTPVKVPIALTQWRESSMYITDKEVGMITSGIVPAEMKECLKAIANDVNLFFYGLYWQVYGMVGTPGTTAFNAGTTADAIAARKLLNKQLAPFDNRVGILDVEAEAKVFAVAEFVRADARADATSLKTGILSNLMGIDWYMDQLVTRHVSTVLTAGAATVNGAHVVDFGSTDGGRTGTVSIAKASNASPLVKGDILTFAGDTQQYAVVADVSLIVGNTLVTIAPALKTAKSGAEAVTLAASHTVNLVFSRDAISFASRPLSALSIGGVSQGDFFSVADDHTGLVLRAELVRQNKQTLLQFDTLYGGKVTRPELAVRLAGQ